MMRRLSASLYSWDDTCAVYLIKNGDDGVLIDMGDGSILDALSSAGVRRITDVLMTHHHRDQGQGLARAAREGVRIWVPHTEQDLFSCVNQHWQSRTLFNSYDNREDRFSLLESVPVYGTLQDYATLRFGALTLKVIPTPGHTPGSLSLLVELDGQRVIFSGDLIAAPGKVWSLAATQWSYNGAEGVAAAVASLLDLKTYTPDMLLPSHGEPMAHPTGAIDLLVARLWSLLRAREQNPRLFLLRETPFVVLTPHLLWNRTAMAYWYVLLSESGKALLFDFGYDFVTGVAAGSDRASRRPWLYTLPALKRDFGVTTIEAVIPTHYHDDHVAGLNLLRDVEGAQVWAADVFAAVLERPQEYDLPCLWYDPIPVDRVLPLETPITWEEYSLTLHHLPGHTHYAVAISLEVDGRRVVIAGDQYQGGSEAHWNYVYKNGFAPDDYQESAALYRRLAPELILSGHWDPYWVEPGYFERLDQRGETLARLHRELLPLDTLDFGTAGFGVRINPYQSEVTAAESFALTVTIKNPFAHPEMVAAQLALPDGWCSEPERQVLSLEAHASGTLSFDVIPAQVAVRRARVAADLSVGATRFGQLAEALITVRLPGAGGVSSA
jgi:glyoxylase-like metal-dependent hydrolase (beta-lactamase superfamily II)